MGSAASSAAISACSSGRSAPALPDAISAIASREDRLLDQRQRVFLAGLRNPLLSRELITCGPAHFSFFRMFAARL